MTDNLFIDEVQGHQKRYRRLIDFTHSSTRAAFIMLLAAVAAVIVANTDAYGPFEEFLHIEIGFFFGDQMAGMYIANVINALFMALFFLLVGLEIKYEMTVGELTNIRQAILPIMGAVGGVLVPIGVYLAFNAANPETAHGWGVPTATDIAFALGILALLTSIVPIVNNFSFILALIGVVFALVGVIACARGKKRGKGMGIASLIINILALVVVLALQSAWSAAIDEAFDTGTTAEQQDVSADEGAADGDAAQAEDDASGNATQSASEYEVTIDSASMTTDYEDNPARVVNYTWTNNSDEATSFAVAFDETCFQNGVEREMAIVSDVDTSNYMNEVQPGSSAEVTLCYELEDESEVTVEVKELFNLDDTVLAEKSFDPATL